MKKKKSLRLVGKKVPRSKPAFLVDPMVQMAADAQRFNAFVQAQTMMAREEGIKMGAGLDAYESMKALAVEAMEARAALERVLECVDRAQTFDNANEALMADLNIARSVATSFLVKPRAAFVMKLTADAPSVPQPAHTADSGASLPVEPQSDAKPEESVH